MLPTNRIYRRFSSKNPKVKPTPTRKLIVFQIGAEKYALPIEQVVRVLEEFTPRGSLKNGRSLVKEREGIITVIDPSVLLFSNLEKTDSGTDKFGNRHYLIVCTVKTPNLPQPNPRDEEIKQPQKLLELESIGIPVPEMPKVLEITEDKIEEVPEFYRQGSLSLAIEKLINISENEVVFYLNLERFWE